MALPCAIVCHRSIVRARAGENLEIKRKKKPRIPTAATAVSVIEYRFNAKLRKIPVRCLQKERNKSDRVVCVTITHADTLALSRFSSWDRIIGKRHDNVIASDALSE